MPKGILSGVVGGAVGGVELEALLNGIFYHNCFCISFQQINLEKITLRTTYCIIRKYKEKSHGVSGGNYFNP